MSLLADPNFDALSLSAAQQTRLSDIKTLVNRTYVSPDHLAPRRMADRDDTWWYSHDLTTNLQAQLLVFRATGDVWFLDMIHELCSIMNSRLAAPYRDTCNDPGGAQEGYSDGYLKWVERAYPTCANQGTDIRRDYDYGAHYCSILMAYVLHVNRGVTSPTGKDYGALADSTLAYHINHYEAKFRARNSKPTGFPLEAWPASQTSRIGNLMMWHYYMGLLRNDSAYTAEAVRLSDAFKVELRVAPSPSGEAYVWRRQVKGLDNHGFGDYLSPSTYSEHVISLLMDARFQGFDGWDDDVHMQRFGRMLTEFMDDTGDPFNNNFADCIGGNQDRAGYSTWSSSHTRPTRAFYTNGMWGTLSPWDASGKIAGWNAQYLAWAEPNGNTNDPTRLYAAQFLHEHLAP